MRFSSGLVLMVFLLLQGGMVMGAVDPLSDDQLQVLVEEALRNNPELQAARERWEMYQHKIVPAGALEDPMLGVAFSNYPIDSFAADRTPMTGNEIRLEQKFPFPGKLAEKTEMARQQSHWFRSVYEDARLQLSGKVKDSYYRLFYLEGALAVTEENLGILDSFISLTATRYEVGRGLQQDVLKAQVEQSKLTDKLIALRQQRRSLQAQLTRLLGRQDAPALVLPDQLRLPEVPADAGRLKALARTQRPMFAAYQSVIERYASQRQLAKLDYYPNLTVWTSYRFRDDDLPDQGTDFLSAGVGVNLPLWREKRSAAVAEADSAIRMARRQFEEFANQVDFTIEDALAGLQKNHDQALLYQTGIIPQAQQSFDASLSAYQVGKIELLSLLDSLMTLYRYQIDYQRALSDALRDITRLEVATGRLIDALKTSQATNQNGLQP